MTTIMPYIQLMRPLQWAKSAFIIAPIFFALKWQDAGAWVDIIWAVVAFTCVASVVYILNDWVDLKDDMRHPTKSARPLAAGTVSPKLVLLQAFGLLVLSGFICATFLSSAAVIVVSIYLISNIAYTLFFKRIAMVDVVVLACFYVLRILMGCAALGVPASDWIILTTFFLALTIGFAKRGGELQLSDFASDKPNLQGYSPPLIWCLLGMCSAATLITYAIYAVEKQAQLGGHVLVYGVAFVAAGFFRFLSLALVDGKGGEPEKLILKDRLLLAIMLLWFLLTIASIMPPSHHSIG